MPTLPTHAVVGLSLAKVYEVLAGQPPSLLFQGMAAGLAMLPDLDVLAFPLGIPYAHRFGHRGIVHSLACAAVVSRLAMLACQDVLPISWAVLWGLFFLAMASHGLLDAMTNGGMGIALLAPFDDTRYFLPWQPIQVSPLGRAVFSEWGLRVLASEAFWVWAPCAAVLGGVLWFRS